MEKQKNALEVENKELKRQSIEAVSSVEAVSAFSYTLNPVSVSMATLGIDTSFCR